MMVEQKLVCYTINSNSSDGFRVCFTATEYAAGGNGQLLDGAVMKFTAIFMADHENRSIRCLYHYNHGYAYAVVESLNGSSN